MLVLLLLVHIWTLLTLPSTQVIIVVLQTTHHSKVPHITLLTGSRRRPTCPHRIPGTASLLLLPLRLLPTTCTGHLLLLKVLAARLPQQLHRVPWTRTICHSLPEYYMSEIGINVKTMSPFQVSKVILVLK